MSSATSRMGTAREINILKESDTGRRKEEGGGEATASSSKSSTGKIRTLGVSPRGHGAVFIFKQAPQNLQVHGAPGQEREGRGLGQGTEGRGRHQPPAAPEVRAAGRASCVLPRDREDEVARDRDQRKQRFAETPASQPPDLRQCLSLAEAFPISQGCTVTW